MLYAPLIAFTFAHERNETNPPVRNLLKEQLQITSLVSPLVQQKYCETQALVNVGVERLNELIDREGQRLIGLHYASDVATLLRAREGKEKSVERAIKSKLGRKLGALPHLKWVFLSGDGSQEQAEALIRAGVPLVIRSQNMINDDAAFRLAYFFYQSLGQGLTLGQACDKSISEVRRDYVNKAKLTYEHEPPSGYGSDWPFAFHVNQHLASPLWWSVHHARGNEGAGLPRVEGNSLPPLPFTDFAPLTEEYQLCAVGKEREMRAVYEMMQSDSGPPVIVVSGRPKVGKTSFLRAQLSPLLNRDFHVRYAAFQQDSLTTLSRALASDEDLSLVRTWVELEGGKEGVMLQPQMITELMNEAQSSFRSHYRADRADFSQFLRVVRAMWTRDELGEGDNLLTRLGMLFDQQSKINQEEELTGKSDIRPLAVILDQFEESFSPKSSLEMRRQERFWEAIHQLCYNPDRLFRGGLVIGIDDHYCAQLLEVLNEQKLSYEHVHLPALTRQDLTGYLERLRQQTQLREHFPLMIDEQTPTAWSQLLESTPPEELGYRFHAMMRHVWERQSQRPLLISVDLMQRELGARSQLSDLLLRRVQDFIALMHAQGDEDLNERFALDLLYSMANSDQRVLDIEDFLVEYLNWNVELPEPWASRQRSLSDQSLWVLTQAIDLGLFRGRLTAGSSLPSGSLSLVHSELKTVLAQEWSERLGAYARAIERLTDYAYADLTPSPEDVELAKIAFSSMRLPTPEEAEILLRGLAHHQDLEKRDQVSTRRDKLLIATLCLVLTLSMGRCAQIGGNYDDLMVNHDRANDQVRLLAADHAQRDGQVHNAAALLTEVRQPKLGSAWEALTLASLNTALIADRVTSVHAWRRAKMTPKSMLVERYNQEKVLWSGQPLKLTHELGGATHLDHDESGQHWVSFESGMLLFWSIETPQATRKRLAFDQIKSLHLSHEGTIAAVLNQEGVVSLYRSYSYPVKEFGGIKGAPVVRCVLSPDRKSLLLIDARDGVQSVSLTDERVDMSIESPQGLQLRQSLWVKSTPPSVALHYSIGQNKEQRLIWYQRGREPLLIHQGSESITQLFTSPHLAQVVVELKTSSRQPHASRILKIVDLTHPQHANSVITPQLPPVNTLTFDPTGTRIVVASASSTVQQLKLFSLRERSPALDLKTTYATQPNALHISQDGQSILGMSAEGVTRWNAIDGRVLASYHYSGMTPIALADVDASLRVAFSDQDQQSRSAMLTWLLNEDILSVPVSTAREEVADATWHNDELIIGNQRGEVTLWSAHQLSAPKVKFQGHQERVSVIKVHVDQQSFVSASTDGSVARWSIRDGRALARYEGHKAPVTALGISPRSDRAAIVSGDRRGMIWYWREASPSGTSWRAHRSQIRSLAISPTGSLLVSIPANKREKIAVWKLKRDRQPQQVASLPERLVAASWSQQGQGDQLIGVTRQGQLISWSSTGGAIKELGNFNQSLNGAQVSSAQFSSQNDWLIGLTDQGTGILYYIPRARAQLITIPQGKLKVAQFLSSVESGPRVPALALGSSSGRLWLWRAGRLMPLGDLQGPLVKLEVSPKDGSLFSASETLALRWQGPFELSNLKERLAQRSRVCLSVSDRISLLTEPTAEAQRRYQECIRAR